MKQWTVARPWVCGASFGIWGSDITRKTLNPITLNSKTLQPKPWNSEESWQRWAQGAALQDAFIRVRIRGGWGDINPFKRARSRVKKGPL